MLVHLKPKRESKCSQVMENYIQKTNWNYRLNNPIHCKRSQNSKRIKNLLTQKVFTQGKSIQRLCPKYTKYSIDTSILKSDTKQMKLKQTIEEDKKKKQQWEKCTVIQLSTLYKKSFKYNTTIHQILKNLTKNKESKNTKQNSDNSNTQPNDTIKSQPILQPQSKDQAQQPQSPIKLRLHRLQTIKNQCSRLESMNERQQDKYYHVNQLRFVENEQQKIIMKSSQYQWKFNKPHYTKLKWRKSSVVKRNKKNETTQSLGQQKIKVKINGFNQQNYLDSIFYPACSHHEGIFTTYNNHTVDNYNFNQTEKIKQELKKTKYKQQSQSYIKMDLSKTQRSYFEKKKNFQKKFKTMREHVFGNDNNPEFSLQAWNTKQRQQCQILQSQVL